MPLVLAWWQRSSRRTKGRLIFYPGVLLAAGGFLAFTMVMPGRSHRGPLPTLGPERERLADRVREDVTALVGERGDRSQRSPGTLDRASGMIEASFRDIGFAVTRLPFTSDGVTVANLE